MVLRVPGCTYCPIAPLMVIGYDCSVRLLSPAMEHTKCSNPSEEYEKVAKFVNDLL